MSLIIFTGIPSCGKSKRVKDLKEYFEQQKKSVIVISENDYLKNLKKNDIYSDANKEKELRSVLKSQVTKHLKPNIIVILDGLNYIKGYRYELYCITKANKCTQCTVLVQMNHEEAWKLNENRDSSDKYTKEIFDALLQRYEEPDVKNRWEIPLFRVFSNDLLDFNAIKSCLCGKAPTINTSTLKTRLNDTNFLYDLDLITKQVTEEIIQAKNNNMEYKDLLVDPRNVNIDQLRILHRQYLIYSKMHPPELPNARQLFLQYLNTSLK